MNIKNRYIMVVKNTYLVFFTDLQVPRADNLKSCSKINAHKAYNPLNISLFKKTTEYYTKTIARKTNQPIYIPEHLFQLLSESSSIFENTPKSKAIKNIKRLLETSLCCYLQKDTGITNIELIKNLKEEMIHMAAEQEIPIADMPPSFQKYKSGITVKALE